MLCQMNRLTDAAAAYRAVELRYINEPPALEAILGRATCAKQLGRARKPKCWFDRRPWCCSELPTNGTTGFRKQPVTTERDGSNCSAG